MPEDSTTSFARELGQITRCYEDYIALCRDLWIDDNLNGVNAPHDTKEAPVVVLGRLTDHRKQLVAKVAELRAENIKLRAELVKLQKAQR